MSHTTKIEKTRMTTISITLQPEQVEILKQIAQDIGNPTFSAAVRYLIAQYQDGAGIFCGKPDNSSRLSTIDGTICNDCYMHRLEEIVEYLRKNWKKEEPK